MILHIGKGKSVKERDILGIFDLDNSTVTAAGRAFLSRATKEKRVSYADDDIPRSFLLMKDGRVILSHLSTSALNARVEEGRDLRNGRMNEETG